MGQEDALPYCLFAPPLEEIPAYTVVRFGKHRRYLILRASAAPSSVVGPDPAADARMDTPCGRLHELEKVDTALLVQIASNVEVIPIAECRT